jgi:hypothetical protein
MRIRDTLIHFVHSATGTGGQTRCPDQQPGPVIPVYTPKKIVDSEKHIQELAANKQPYANVHIDAIE